MSSTVRGSNNFDSAWGNGQTWQVVGPSRAFGTTYTNSTSAPITVLLSIQGTSSYGVTVTVGGTTICGMYPYNGSTSQCTFVVPAGSTYLATVVQGTGSLQAWSELR